MRSILAAAAITAFLSLLIAQAQVSPQSSEFKATVVDESGALIPDCEMVFRSDSGEIVSHTEMDGSVAVEVRNGAYDLTTSKAGFVTSKLAITVPISNRLRIVLQVDHTPIVDGLGVAEVPTTTSELPSVIEGAEIHRLVVGGGPMPIRIAPPALRKSRSWQCLYLWKCSPHGPSQP